MMERTMDSRLSRIKDFLEIIESKIDNFIDFENISNKEKEELFQIKEEMKKGNFSIYEEVFE